MIFRWIRGSGGTALVAALWVLAAPAAWSAAGGEVTVHRGASVTAEPVAGAEPVQVLRGAPVPVPTPRRAGSPPAEPRLLAGERLWLVDSEAGELTTCATRLSTQVGRSIVRCVSRALPAGRTGAAD